ncbi:MAG: FtsL-like putative cell division protein [Weeksellaceae bacterium]|nr:FtsL-like putative cell division protein [Weeksellaceae bacterium]
MSRKKPKPLSIQDILKGRFLVEGNTFGNWRFVFFLAVLAFISISSAHWADKKVVEIRKMQREVSNLKSKHSELHRDIMQMRMESYVSEKVLQDSIKKSDVQPFKLVYYK